MVMQQLVRIAAGTATLEGDLTVPETAGGLVLFAHGSGSSRHSPRNRFVAQVLQEAELATLLLDLLTLEEEAADDVTGHLRFDIGLLADRLVAALDWLRQEPSTRTLNAGLFGASTGGGAALVAAARRPDQVDAVVCRSGRPDLAGEVLPLVQSPTLLIVGSLDTVVIELNDQALQQLQCERDLRLVPGATHLFEEPGALEDVAQLARDWFRRHLKPVELPTLEGSYAIRSDSCQDVSQFAGNHRISGE